ncbi:MAG: RdgB/HAM1 family non-canonical purine NTP pyrophosphatase, partial [Candidatus Omnitrophica bacterium]|nr:RdgB/HAM1 family non-canonical purine NTP pyrophosphatase [Candidatus Omnitrophota bacterium]
MFEVLIASFNVKKRQELEMLLDGKNKIKIMNFNDLDITPPIIVEDGKTFRQNAVKKALTASRFFEGLVLGDDSGLSVEALHGKPGVRSARFARKNATDAENNSKLLKLLDSVPQKNRKAEFICHIALAKKGILLGSFEGVVKGEISFENKGQSGFGYDPLFIPKGYQETFAEMGAEQKNRISHRAIALKQ